MKGHHARYVVLRTGPLSAPKEPDFPGYRDFKGELYQASRWPHRPISFGGKRVAVIGTGSTRVQAITEIAKIRRGLFRGLPAYPRLLRAAHNRPMDQKEFAARRRAIPNIGAR